MNLENPPKRSVLKDIDKTTMIKMREDGMANRDIAQSIGCSVTTIYNILGKQPDGIRANRRTKAAAQESERTAPPITCTRRLRPLVQVLQGKSCRFRIDSEHGNVSIEPANGTKGFKLSDLPSIVQDIIDLSNDPGIKEAAT